jgi:hypothetical protein
MAETGMSCKVTSTRTVMVFNLGEIREEKFDVFGFVGHSEM